MQGTVVARVVSNKRFTVVTAAGGPTTSASHASSVTFVFIVPRVGKIVLRGPIQNWVLKIRTIEVLLWAGGGGGATGVGVLGEGDVAGGGGPGGAVHTLLVFKVHYGVLLVDVVVGG